MSFADIFSAKPPTNPPKAPPTMSPIMKPTEPAIVAPMVPPTSKPNIIPVTIYQSACLRGLGLSGLVPMSYNS